MARGTEFGVLDTLYGDITFRDRMVALLSPTSSTATYPAMIADDLATELACQFVNEESRVFDPFAGNRSNLIAAAGRGATCVGMDVNPLAVLISRAKISQPRKKFDELIVGPYRLGPHRKPLDFQSGRKVVWFSKRAEKELAQQSVG